MAIQPQNLSNLIIGTIRLDEPTLERDTNKKILWSGTCVCGHIEVATKTDFLKYAGYDQCPGHPFKELALKPINGFNVHPDDNDTPEHAAALAAWDAKRGQTHSETAELNDSTVSPAQLIPQELADLPNQVEQPITQVTQESPKKVKDSSLPPTESSILQKRLGLTGYVTTSLPLTIPISILGCTAEKVVFAKKITGDDPDLVLLHLQLFDTATQKHSIVSSKKKIPAGEWTALTAVLAEMNVAWREKSQRTSSKENILASSKPV
ncbi:MAG: hypothetical protein WCP20_04705 [Desulfuromonadales bacterium]